MIFYSHVNTTLFHRKGCPLGLILKVRVFGTRKWRIALRRFPAPPPWLHVFSGEGKDKRLLADLVRSEVFFPSDLRLNFFNACYQWLNVSLDACMIFVRRKHQRHSPAILFTSPKTACFVDVLGTSRPIIPRE